MYTMRLISDRIKDYCWGRSKSTRIHTGPKEWTTTLGSPSAPQTLLLCDWVLAAPIARRRTNHPETRTTKCGWPLPALVTTFRVPDRYPSRTKTQARRGGTGRSIHLVLSAVVAATAAAATYSIVTTMAQRMPNTKKSCVSGNKKKKLSPDWDRDKHVTKKFLTELSKPGIDEHSAFASSLEFQSIPLLYQKQENEGNKV